MWSNDMKCKYMLIFPLKNLARKEIYIIINTKDSNGALCVHCTWSVQTEHTTAQGNAEPQAEPYF